MLVEALFPLVGSFRDRVVLVTGASSGIGREAALTFGKLGASVALVARRREPLEAAADAITRAGGRALVVPADVSDARAARPCVAKVRRKWGRIDVLLNNAGVMVPARVEDLTLPEFEAMWRVNVIGALWMMQAVLAVMRAQASGSIVNVASLAGRRGVTPLGGYCATKFALVGLTEALRTELDAAQIHVGLVMPGVVETPMAAQITEDPRITGWPSALNMPPEWVVAAILLAVRFRLREVSVPPGATTIELLGAMAPAVSDTLIRWGRLAGELVAGVTERRARGKARAKKR
jgi:hypothetical protein